MQTFMYGREIVERCIAWNVMQDACAKIAVQQRLRGMENSPGHLLQALAMQEWFKDIEKERNWDAHDHSVTCTTTPSNYPCARARGYL